MCDLISLFAGKPFDPTKIHSIWYLNLNKFVNQMNIIKHEFCQVYQTTYVYFIRS